MSVENLKKYTEHCTTDEGAKARAKDIGHDDLDAHIAHAKEQGFEFSAEHVTAMRDELIASGDLTEEQLEAAAGGTPTAMAAAAAAAVGVAGFFAGAAIVGADW